MPEPFNADTIATRLFNGQNTGWEDMRDALLAAYHAGAAEMRERAAGQLDEDTCDFYNPEVAEVIEAALARVLSLPLTAPESEATDEQTTSRVPSHEPGKDGRR